MASGCVHGCDIQIISASLLPEGIQLRNTVEGEAGKGMVRGGKAESTSFEECAIGKTVTV